MPKTQGEPITQEEIMVLGSQWGARFRDLVPDDFLDAYLEGKRKAVEIYLNSIKDKKKQHLFEAMKYSSEVIDLLQNELSMSIKTAYLRQMSSGEDCINKTLIVVDKEQYLSDKTKKAYQLLINKTKALRKSGVDLNFALMPEKEYDADALGGDGFFYKYDDAKKRPRVA
jgi:hypothetical protein